MPELQHRPQTDIQPVRHDAEPSQQTGGPGNLARQQQLAGGGGSATQHTGDNAWGSAISEEAELQAPYRIEIAEGHVARAGQRGGIVPWLQGALGRLGYSATASGEMDAETVAALTEWQRLNQVATTGELGPTTLAELDRAIEASITLRQFQANAPGVSVDTLREYLPHLNASMLRAGITSDTRKAVYIAQLGHESDGFNTLEEYASGADYEGREDLGNVHPGDGRRFKGRGPIQITGRDNYESYGAAIGHDIVSDPELAATPEIGFQLAAEYWTRNGLNRYADNGQFNTVTQRINGGQNGAPDRRNRWRRAQRVLREDDRAPAVSPRPTPRPDNLGQVQPVGPSPLDEAFERLASGEPAAALAVLGEVDGVAPDVLQRTQNIARFMLDAIEALDTERFEEAKNSAHQAANLARVLRNARVVSTDRADAVVAIAGRYWTQANEAARNHGNSADIAIIEQALPLRRGDRGEAVAALQRLLGMDVQSGAGIFGPQTEAAVKRFQRENNLGDDGVVGSGTLGAFSG